VPGTLINVNTLDTFKQLERPALLHQVHTGERVPPVRFRGRQPQHLASPTKPPRSVVPKAFV